MKKLLICIIALMMLYPATRTALAANDSVQVSIPQFNVTLNGRQIDSAHEKYPLLHYKGIVYLPITAYSEFLGISCTWNEQSKSYYVKKVDTISEAATTAKQSTKNRAYYSAQIINNSVHILHYPEPITVENPVAEYPILKFRDVLYFPLTWQYTHDVFGWEYQWAEQLGLSIDSRESIRPQLSMYYPGEEVSQRVLAHEFQYTYFPDGYAQYYKNQEDPVFFLDIKIKGYPKRDFGMKFKERFFPALEAYTMPGKINQFWSAPKQKIENPQIDIVHNGNLVMVPFVYLKDFVTAPSVTFGHIENGTEVQNCLVTLDLETGEIVNVQNLSLEEAYAYKASHNVSSTNS